MGAVCSNCSIECDGATGVGGESFRIISTFIVGRVDHELGRPRSDCLGFQGSIPRLAAVASMN